MGQEFGSASAVCSIEDSSGPQSLQVSIVLKASKSAGAKGDVPKIYGFVHPLHLCLRISYMHCIVASSSPSCIEAHAGLIRLLVKSDF